MRKRWLSIKSIASKGGAVLGLGALALCSGSLASCKKKPPAPTPPPDPSAETAEIAEDAPPSASVPAPPAVPARCRQAAGAGSFRIGEDSASIAHSSGPDDAGPDEDDEVPAPFSVELGPARADTTGFVLSALRSLKGQSHALIGVLDDAGSGKLVDLGAVHGDPDPPLFAEHGRDLLIAVPDTDAGGTMLKLGVLRDVRGAADLHWGQEITGVRRDSTFALEVSADRALLVYAAESSGKVSVYGALLDPENLKQKPTPQPLRAERTDVDSPQLARRAGGYWLATARASEATKAKPTPPVGDSPDSLDDQAVLDIGTRRIELTKLDARGKAVSSPLAVTPGSARPISFGLSTAADGGAYLAFREDDSTPGADGGALELVHVRADGSLEKVELDGDSSGTGTPSLLADAIDSAKVWVSCAGENGATWFGRIAPHTTLAPDALLRGAELLAARDGKLLVARSRGTAAELSLLQCSD